jgi:SSS family solute:Na+ symporter
VIGAYFALVYLVVFWHARTNCADATEYFLAGRNAGWFIVGASIFASNIGSKHLVGLAGSGAAGDFPAAQFELLAAFALLLLGWLFVPFYVRSGVFTMPEFLERRYSAGTRYYLAAISILAYVLTKISVTIAAGGIVFETLMGIDFWTGAMLIVVATGIYTVIGGMRAVLYSDMLQSVVMIGGAKAPIPNFRGPAYFSAPRYSPSGTGAPTSTSCNERLRPTRFRRHGARPSSPHFSSSCLSLYSSCPASWHSRWPNRVCWN